MTISPRASYIVQSAIGLGMYAVLNVIVTVRVWSANQLGLATQIAACAFLWILWVYFILVLWRYYKRLPNSFD
jgi:hypothetical protein